MYLSALRSKIRSSIQLFNFLHLSFFRRSEQSHKPICCLRKVISVHCSNDIRYFAMCRRSNQNRPLFCFKSTGDTLARSDWRLFGSGGNQDSGHNNFWRSTIRVRADFVFGFGSEVRASNNQEQNAVTLQRGTEASSSSKRNKWGAARRGHRLCRIRRRGAFQQRRWI
jgi:hypothetical protein